MLHRGGVQAGAEFREVGLTFFSRVAENADLDQTVGLERAIGFTNDGIAETFFGDGDDGTQGVGLSAQFAALSGTQGGG